MSETGKLGLEYWQVGSVQPQVSVNDALRVLDTIGSNTVISRSTAAQPATPDPGDAYILPETPTGDDWGAWDEGDIAVYVSGSTPLQPAGWTRILPLAGVPFVVQDSGELVYWEPDSDGGEYIVFAGGGGGGTPTESIIVACSDETTDLTTGAAKVTFRMPYDFTLSAVRASVTTAPTGSVLTVDINESGATILSTKLTIDATEKTSTTATTPAVISDTALADDAEITIDIDTVGSTVAGAGLKVALIGTRVP